MSAQPSPTLVDPTPDLPRGRAEGEAVLLEEQPGPIDLLQALPRWPASWYFACRSTEIGPDKMVRLALGEARLVLFRDQGGQPTALAAACAHMGADLGYGRCRRGELACPLHGWRYGVDGGCKSGYGERHRSARQRRFPVAEAAGCVFVYFAAPDEDEADPPPLPRPVFDSEGMESFAAGAPLLLAIDGPWFWVGGNGFDLRHFEIVHGRRCLRRPEVTEEGDLRTVTYEFEIEGRSFSDTLVRTLLGRQAHLTLSTWRGTWLATEARFGRGVDSRALYFVAPTSETTCLIHVIPLQQRMGGIPLVSRALEQLCLMGKRRLMASFFAEEVATLRNMGQTPTWFTEEDHDLRAFFAWLISAVEPRRAPRGGG